MAPITPDQVRAALEKCPREGHGTLLWLIGDQAPEAARDTAAAALRRRDGV